MTGPRRRPGLLLSAALCIGCTGPASEPRPVVEIALPRDGVFIGRVDAPLAVLEFGSHGCQGCWRFALHGFPVLWRELIEPGSARYRYVDLTGSPLAALVECWSADVGFQAARLAVYRRLDSLSDPSDLAGLRVGVDEACLTDTRRSARRRAEVEAARRARVPGTPTFLIGRAHPDGRVVGWVEVGFTDPESLAAVARAALRAMDVPRAGRDGSRE